MIMGSHGVRDAGGLKIVVADSERAVLELVQIRLDVAGYYACVARTGPAVLEVLQQVRPAAMIIDLGLAELNGFDVLHALNPRGEGLPYPVLVVGRKLAASDVQRAANLGARACMTKPFSGADVLDRVARMLRSPPPARAQAALIG